MHDAHIALLSALAMAYGADKHQAAGIAEVVNAKHAGDLPCRETGEAIASEIAAHVMRAVLLDA